MSILSPPERTGSKAKLRTIRMSAFKARAVLQLIQGKPFDEAVEILTFCDRGAADEILKCLHSAASNAEHNEGLDSEELFVSQCFANEGPTLKRWRPRARGRATRIRKRTCHVTVVLSRYTPEELLDRSERSSHRSTAAVADRRRRVAASQALTDIEEAAEDTTPDGELSDVGSQAEEVVPEETAAGDTAAEDAAVEATVTETTEAEMADEEDTPGAKDEMDTAGENMSDEPETEAVADAEEALQDSEAAAESATVAEADPATSSNSDQDNKQD